MAITEKILRIYEDKLDFVNNPQNVELQIPLNSIYEVIEDFNIVPLELE